MTQLPPGLAGTPVITIDVDWAPDFAIDFLAGMLVRHGVKATWFLTHDSPAVRRLRDHPDLFELGIHPNFYPGSTHGEGEAAILEHCMALVPDATSMRTHGIYQSSNLLITTVERTPVRHDVSLFLPRGRSLHPVLWYSGTGNHLVRLPYLWEDDHEMGRPDAIWSLDGLARARDAGGLVILDVHPIHAYLNSRDWAPYRAFKASAEAMHQADEAQARRHVAAGPGTRTMLEAIVDHLAGRPSFTIRDIADASLPALLAEHPVTHP